MRNPQNVQPVKEGPELAAPLPYHRRLSYIWRRFLNWRDKLRHYLGLVEVNAIDMSQGSSTSQHSKRLRSTTGEIQEISEVDAKRPRRRMDLFEPYFDTPLLSSQAILDFDSCDKEGNPLTAEGLLLRKVLKTATHKDRRTAYCGALGMGGVGKSTALKALCYQKAVQRAYDDGICFLEFGQDANDRKVIEQVARCVRILGGRNEARELNASSSLSDVLEKASFWLRYRSVLLVCDDMWGNEKNKFGYLNSMTILLRETSTSSLVISTRDRDIGFSADGIVEFASLDVEGGRAREILLACVPSIDARSKNPDDATEDYIRRILRICAGLPLALAIAERGLGKTLRSSSTFLSGVRWYCTLIEQDLERITMEELDNHPGLASAIESSLRYCQQWGMSNKAEEQYDRKLDMEWMFRGLCVLEKNMVLPKRALKRLWAIDSKCANVVMEMFADSHLASRAESSLSTELEFGLRLHDLVLERCQQMTVSEHSKWHKRLVDSYANNIGGDRNFEDVGESRAWWRLDEDGYVFAHLSRHLVLSGQAPELRSLLCDIRWTLRRMQVGGLVSLKVDFQRLFGVEEHADPGIRRVHEVLMNSLPYARERPNLLPMYICAHLSEEERNESSVSSLFQSICRHFPKPWLLPVTRYIAAKDRREKWKAVFTDGEQSFPRDISVDWTSGNMHIANGDSIVSWCTNKHRTLLKIAHSANRIALSIDRTFFVSVSYDNTVRRWDAKTGAPIGDPLRGHEGQVKCIALSPDGSIIVTGSCDKTLRLWDAENGTSIGGPLRGHEDEVKCVAVTPDSQVIVSGSRDKTVRRWNAVSGAPIGGPLRGHEDQVKCVAVSPDGNDIVSGSYDGTLRRWDVDSGAPIGVPLREHEDQVKCVAVSPDGQVIVSGSRDRTVRRWDAKSGASIGDPFRGHEDSVTHVASNDDGSAIVSGSWDGTVRGWDVEKHTSIGNQFQGQRNNLNAMSVTRDRSATVLVSNNSRKHPSYVQGQDFHLDFLRGHRREVNCVAMSADEKVVVSVSDDRTLRRWDAKSGASIGDPLLGHKWVTCVAISADGKVIVSGSWDGTVRRLDARSGAVIGGPFRGHLRRVTCVAVSADGQIIVSGSRDKTVRRWHAKSGAPIGDPLRGHEDWVSCVALNADKNQIVSGSWDGTVRRWDSKSGAPVGDPLLGHELPVECVALSADGKVIVSGSCDRTLRRWDATSGTPVGQPLRGHEGSVTYVALSDDGSAIVSKCNGKKIRLWDEHASSRVSSSVSRQPRGRALEGLRYFAPDMSCLGMRLDGGLVVIGSKKGSVMMFRWVE